ncbi:DinB family protein [Mariniflexile fucanivorans]|uniref:DinB family protein n=1 Tax=Mariniflexile fucanivorans TaxID=264023 RepID=A0A4V2QDP0_9FLAO|nr:DinB family protein [Mariniflexile fucanivorans]TCL64577.1 DinB family protein [Mariniflexile fucanivorans]
MQNYCKENLNEIKTVLLQLTNEQYTFQSTTLFGATIGQHVRHIIEFYQSVFSGFEAKTINYDNRVRNLSIETDTKIAIQVIDEICAKLKTENNDIQMILEGNFCAEEGKQIKIETSFLRELAYCLEHSIHHQALIKVGLLEVKCLNFIDDTFGLAPATIRHRKQCVQ